MYFTYLMVVLIVKYNFIFILILYLLQKKTLPDIDVHAITDFTPAILSYQLSTFNDIFLGKRISSFAFNIPESV